MRFHERGATLLGMLTILAILGFALYGGIRLMPMYLEYMAVARALEQTAEEIQGSADNSADAAELTEPSLDYRNDRQHPAQRNRDQEGR